ncbi:hypothetical protein Osc2_24200 [Ruminococcus sp. 25CYCFAH16]
MKIYFKNGMSKDFPMTVFELEDALDMLGTDNPVVDFRISEHENMDLPKSLCRDFTADIYKLNLFAERFERLEYPERAAMESLLASNPECEFEDMLLMTYGLDSVPVWPCKDYYELGEAMIENDMVEELRELPDEYIDLIDREKIGRLVHDKVNGMFIYRYYCVPSEYERPTINIEIGRPEKCFFRLLIAPAPTDSESTEQFAQWISLPCNKENLNDIAKDLGIGRVQDMVYYDFQSALPRITVESFDNMNHIEELNALAEKLSTLSHADFVKLKAVMESQEFTEISDAAECLNCLDSYGFVGNICNANEFGKEYLSRNLPTNFDLSVLEEMDLQDFGSKILSYKGSLATSYGVIYGNNMDLFSALTVQPEREEIQELSMETEMSL